MILLSEINPHFLQSHNTGWSMLLWKEGTIVTRITNSSVNSTLSAFLFLITQEHSYVLWHSAYIVMENVARALKTQIVVFWNVRNNKTLSLLLNPLCIVTLMVPYWLIGIQLVAPWLSALCFWALYHHIIRPAGIIPAIPVPTYSQNQ